MHELNVIQFFLQWEAKKMALPLSVQSWEKSQALQARLRNQLREIEEPFWEEFTLNELVKQPQLSMRNYQ